MLWILFFVGLNVFFTWLFTNSQKDTIRKTTYFEKIVVDGKSRTLQKFKCPSCGNKNLNYQIASGSASTFHSNNGRFSSTNIHNIKYAVCNKCGTSFKTIRKTTPIINFLLAFMLSWIFLVIGLFVNAIIAFMAM